MNYQRTGAEAEKGKSLKDIILGMPISVETNDSDYYGALHQAENKKFHDRLALKMCEKLTPIVSSLLEQFQ